MSSVTMARSGALCISKRRAKACSCLPWCGANWTGLRPDQSVWCSRQSATTNGSTYEPIRSFGRRLTREAPMEILPVDLIAAHAELGALLEGAAVRVLRSGRYIDGPELESFEREFAEFCGVGGAVGTGNGLDALRLALEALSIGQGDEV